ncbi:MAG: acyl-CoA thioesterase [Lawsonella clevelandensis]
MSNRAGNYSCELEIRWSDFDQSGEVTDTTYIELAREARLRFVKDTWIRRGFTAPPMVVRHLEVDYLKPLLFGMEQVKVELTVQAVTASSYHSDTSYVTSEATSLPWWTVCWLPSISTPDARWNSNRHSNLCSPSIKPLLTVISDHPTLRKPHAELG